MTSLTIATRSAPSGTVWVYKYAQLDGPQALTIYGAKEPLRQRWQAKYGCNPPISSLFASRCILST